MKKYILLILLSIGIVSHAQINPQPPFADFIVFDQSGQLANCQMANPTTLPCTVNVCVGKTVDLTIEEITMSPQSGSAEYYFGGLRPDYSSCQTGGSWADTLNLTFTSIGYFPVTASISDQDCPDGHPGQTATVVFAVGKGDNVHNYQADTLSPCLGDSICFEYFFGNDTVYGLSISFGDGSSYQNNNPITGYFEICHYYSSPGVYQTSGNFNTSCGYQDNHTVEVVAPEAKFTYSQLCGFVFSFKNESSCPQSILSYLWDFGDGSTSTIQNPSHTFSELGVYPVTLTIAYGPGYSSSQTQLVTVEQGYDFEISGPNHNCNWDTLNPLQYELPSNLVNYSWSVNNGATLVSSGNQADVDLRNVTQYPVVLYYTATDRTNKECVYSDSLLIFDCCEPSNPSDTDFVVVDWDYEDFIFYTDTEVHTNKNFYINGTLTLDDGAIFLQNCNVYLNGNAKIVVERNNLPDGVFAGLFADDCLFTTCTDYMWDGIYADGFDETIQFADCFVTGAQQAINGSSQALIHLFECEFEANHVSGRFENEIDQRGQLNYNIIRGTTNLLAPYQNSNEITGFEFLNFRDSLSYLTTIMGNEFSELNIGVSCENSGLTFYDNDFTNFLANGIGIKAWNSPVFKGLDEVPTYFGGNLNIGGVANGNGNYFYKVRRGIETKNVKPRILNNILNDVTDGITVLETSFARIQGNEIGGNVTSSGGVAPHYGVKVWNAFYAAFGHNSITISGNGISSYNRGVSIQNLNGNDVVVDGNTVINNNGTFFNRHIGIQVNNSDLSQIRNNQVTSTATGSNINGKRGIEVNNSILATINDNYLKNQGAGIFANGFLRQTRYSCNEFNACKTGMFFNGDANPTVIGQQAAPNVCAGNEYINIQGPWKMDGKTNNNIWPAWHYGTSTIENILPYNPTILIDDRQEPLCLGCKPPDPNVVDTLSDLVNYSERLGELVSEINQGLALADTLQDSINHFAKETIYGLLAGEMPNPVSNQYSSEYQSFLNQMNATTTASEWNWLENLGGIQNQASVSPGFSLTSQEYLNGYLFNRSIDTGMVRYIAEQNPLMLGNVVYSARTILGVEIEDSLGTVQGPSNKLQGNFIQDLEVFPNPSAGLIQIQGTKGLAEVQVYDLTGALVFTKSQVQSLVDIGHLPLGVYLVRIQTNETIYVGKVQLIK